MIFACVAHHVRMSGGGPGRGSGVFGDEYAMGPAFLPPSPAGGGAGTAATMDPTGPSLLWFECVHASVLRSFIIGVCRLEACLAQSELGWEPMSPRVLSCDIPPSLTSTTPPPRLAPVAGTRFSQSCGWMLGCSSMACWRSMCCFGTACARRWRWRALTGANPSVPPTTTGWVLTWTTL